MSNFLNFIKYTLLLLFISFLIATTCFVFGYVLIGISKLAFSLFPYNLIILPLVGILIIYFKNLRQEHIDGSMVKVFNSTQTESHLSILIIPFQITTTWLSHLAGASVGREGVALQLGATIANNVADKFNLDLKVLTSSGKAAGFSGLFGTPLAGIFFAYEMNNKDLKDYKFWYSAIVMSFASSILTTFFGLSHFHKPLNINISEFFNLIIIIKIIIVTMIIILIGNLFVFLLKKQRKIYIAIFKNEYIKIAILSIIFIIFMILVNGRYMSLGTNLINLAFDNPQNILYIDFILKMIFTTFIIAIGFQGGEVTPLFAIGASLGVVLASILNLPIAIIAALGYSYMFGHATNAYLASFFICIEVFGIKMLPYALVVLLISIPFRNKNSIYPLFD